MKNPLLSCLFALLAALASVPALAQSDAGALAQQVQRFAQEAAARVATPQVRVEVKVGQLDPRLRLAPCQDVQPYLPVGTRLWGAARIGLRCGDPGVRWNVYLPITVQAWGPAVVAAGALPAGTVLAAADLASAEVDLAAAPAPALTRPELAIGRSLARPLAAGTALRTSDLRARQWFAAGDTVRIVAVGAGWRIGGEGQALAPGLEGQAVRVRTESGRVVSGTAAGERLVEVAL